MSAKRPTPQTSSSRRAWLRLTLAGGGAAVLAGCGFQLRQAPHFSFQTIHLNAPANSPIAQALRRQLQSTPVRVTGVAQAQVLLDILTEQRERVVVGLNANGEVREVQIRSRVRFRVRGHDDQELVPDTELLREMDVSYAESQALAKDAEIDMLFRAMEADAVQQIMRRLAMIKGVSPVPGEAGALAPASAAAPGATGDATPAASPTRPASGTGW